MRAGLRDLRLLPAAIAAWCVAGILVGMRGAESAAIPIALVGWIVAAACCVGAVVLGLGGGARRMQAISPNAGGIARKVPALRNSACIRGALHAFLPALAMVATAAAWPATTVALGAATRFEAMPEWAMAAEPLREGFRQLVAAMPGDGGELLPGLAIGDDGMVGPALLEAMRVTSLAYTLLQ